MAARSIWSGSLSFGLVNVPVKLYGAVVPKNVKFNQINAKTGARIQQKRVDAGTGDAVDFEDIVKGYEITPDRYIVISPEELADVAPKQTKTIELEEFVPLDQINPMIYDKSYYLAPDTGAAKSYKLLAAVMEQDGGKVGIGSIILRSKEQLAAVRAENGHMVLSTLAWADEVTPPNMIDISDAAEPSDREIAMGTSLIENLTVDFDHGAREDTYRAKVMAMIEAKAAGEEWTAPEKGEDEAPTGDLMAALEASLSAAPKKKERKAPVKKAKSTEKQVA